MFEKGDLLRGYAKVLQKDGTMLPLYRVDAIVKNDEEKYSDLEILDQYGKLEEIKKIIETEGIEFVRIGNTENTARQGSVMITADDPPNSPYIDVRDKIKSHSDFDNGLPKVRLGNLEGINDQQFGKLKGYGLYSENVYLKGQIVIANPQDIKGSQINNNAGWTDDTTANAAYNLANQAQSMVGSKNRCFYGDTNPSGMVKGDTWFKSNGDIYSYDGEKWVGQVGVGIGIGTKINSQGIYTGTLTADQVNAVGINASNITSGTLTGVVIKSISQNHRIELSGNKLSFNGADPGTEAGYITSTSQYGVPQNNTFTIHGTNGKIIFDSFFNKQSMNLKMESIYFQGSANNHAYMSPQYGIELQATNNSGGYEEGSIVKLNGSWLYIEKNGEYSCVSANDIQEGNVSLKDKYAIKSHIHSDYAPVNHSHSDYDTRITTITDRFNTFESSTLSGIQATLQDLRDRVSRLEQNQGYV